MATWFLTIDTARQTGDANVDLEVLGTLAQHLEADGYRPSIHGGGACYGAVLQLEGDDPSSLVWIGLLDFYRARQAAGLPDWPVVHYDMIEWTAFLQRRAARTGLVGSHEAAEMLGVSRQRFCDLARRDDFPQPVARLAATRIWQTAAIARYGSERRTTPGRPPASWTIVT